MVGRAYESLRVAIWLILVAGCRPPVSEPTSTADPGVDRLEERMARHEEDVSEVEATANSLNAKWANVTDVYRRASEEHRRTWSLYENAAASFGEASQRAREAAATWERARVKWEIAQILIETAAMLDARNLSRWQAREMKLDTNDLNCDRVSTQSYRKQLQREGVDLSGLDVDHIVPKSKGGADHPLNYQLLDSSTNRSLGNTWGHEKCVGAGMTRCVAAVAVSRVCGAYGG